MPVINGAVARALEPPLAIAQAKPNKEAPTKEEVEHLIGEAVVAAATALGQALLEFNHDGGLDPATRARGGETISWLYQLQEAASGTLDFAATVHEQGRLRLQENLGAAFRQRHGAAHADAALDEIVGWISEILANVTACERAMAH